jgi:hypothetical protein
MLVEPFHLKWKVLSSFIIFIFMLNEVIFTSCSQIRRCLCSLGKWLYFFEKCLHLSFFFNGKSPKKDIIFKKRIYHNLLLLLFNLPNSFLLVTHLWVLWKIIMGENWNLPRDDCHFGSIMECKKKWFIFPKSLCSPRYCLCSLRT